MLRTLQRLPFGKIHEISQILRQSQLIRYRHYWKNMDCVDLNPPNTVRGMRELQRDVFTKRVQIPCLRIRKEQANKVLPLLKTLQLKMEKVHPFRPLESENSNEYNELLLHPLPVKNWESLPTEKLTQLNVNASDFYFNDLELSYNNWRPDEILKSVLPIEEEGLTSYSRIGHIVHLNLRDHLLPYKKLIGQVFLDKLPNCRTIVNKVATIDNTYRNFQMELVNGEPDYQVETKENGVTFEFDFSKVYWNPRLSTEHERIVKMLRPNDVLYDVFAGVGPFSIPAARKRCHVLANDLNPESFRWLQHNAKRNKCLSNIEMYNKDGRDFILEEVKADLLKRWSDEQTTDAAATYRMHITMNLPAMAVEFLSAFRGLCATESNNLNFSAANFNYPIVHVYLFAKGSDTKSLAHDLVEQHLGLPLTDNFEGIQFVRNVAPTKDMYRVSFRLTKEILTEPMESNDQNEMETKVSSPKKRKNDNDDKVTQIKLKCA